MMTKEKSTKIVTFMTPGAGVLVYDYTAENCNRSVGNRFRTVPHLGLVISGYRLFMRPKQPKPRVITECHYKDSFLLKDQRGPAKKPTNFAATQVFIIFSGISIMGR